MIMEGDRKKAKILASDLMLFINTKQTLKEQFYVYQNIKNTTIKDKDIADTFINEIFRPLKKYNFNDIKIHNAILETKLKPHKIKSSTINSAIANVIKYECSGCRFTEKEINSKKIITEHLTKDKSVDKSINENRYDELKYLNSEHILKMAVKNFNKKYVPNLDKYDMEMFTVLKEGNEKTLRTFHNSIIKDIQKYKKLIGSSFKDELKEKIEKAIQIIENYNIDNLYSSYELLSELRNTTKELV